MTTSSDDPRIIGPSTGIGARLFAVSLLLLGVVGLISQKFAEVWQPVPAWVPAQAPLALLCGIVMLMVGAGLLCKPTVPIAARILFIYLLLWILLLEVPPFVQHLTVETQWAQIGEIAILLAGGWVLFAGTAAGPAFALGASGVRIARLLLVFGVVTVGIEHIVYAEPTAGFVPAWLPFRLGWAYLTGVAHIAAGAGVLFNVVPRLAALLETAMISIFTLLVWLPGVMKTPTDHFTVTGFLISCVLGFAVWIVADTYRPLAGSPA